MAAILFRGLARTAVTEKIDALTHQPFVVERLDAFYRGGELSQRRLREHRLEHLTTISRQ